MKLKVYDTLWPKNSASTCIPRETLTHAYSRMLFEALEKKNSKKLET